MRNHLQYLSKLEGHKGCFGASTLVLTPHGKKPICLIEAGDIVIAFDDRGRMYEKKVLEIHKHENQETFCYSFWGGIDLIATPNHFVLNQYGTFACIGTLTNDDGIVDKRGHVRPFMRKMKAGVQTVYNLTVEEMHTFIANDLCVHNGGLDMSELPCLAGNKGGKGGGGSIPFREDPNTLQANTTARILEVISCGPIHGLVDGAKSVYLEGTPVQNKDGSINFRGISFDFRPGTFEQEIIKGFETIRTEYSVGVEIKKKFPVVRKIKLADETAIVIRLSFPRGLAYQNTGANALTGTSVSFNIEFSYDNGPYKTVARNLTVQGKTSSAYERSFYFGLEKASEVDIRITRITEDGDSALMYNDSSFSGYTLCSGYKLNYPGAALMAYTINAQEFGTNLPSRVVHVKGLIVDVPSNYNPETRKYAGLWDGTFKKAYTNNPAWFLWWILHDDYNGLGGIIPDWAMHFTKTDLYEIAKYCDELVPDGFGGYEPRFTFNAQIMEAQNALEFLRLICSTCNVQVFWSAQNITFSQERKKDIARIFNKSNVINGEFEYSQVDLASRHSVFAVSYNDMSNLGKANTEVVEDRELIGKIGIKKHSVSLVGCTSRGQARRIAKHLLFLEKLCDFTISFKIGLAECDILPGQLIGIFDKDFINADIAGRIKHYEDKKLVLDRKIEFLSAYEYYIYLTLSDGLPQRISIINPGKKTDTVSLAAAPKLEPVKGAVFGIFSTQVNPQEYMVLGISDNGDNTFTVNAMQYDQRIFKMVEENLVLPKPPTSLFPSGPVLPPSNFSVLEYLYGESGQIKAGAIFSYEKPNDARILYFEIEIQNPVSEVFESYGLYSGNSFDIKDVIKGEYRFRIRSVTGIGIKSVFAEYNCYLYGMEQPFPDVTGFTTVYKAGKLYLVWDEVTDLRNFKYEVRLGNTWEDSFRVTQTVLTETPVISDGTYFIKAVFQNAQSVNAASLEVEGSSFLQQNVIAEVDEAEDFWNGTKNGLDVIRNMLVLSSGADFYAIPDLYEENDVYLYHYTGKESIYELLPEKDITLSSNHLCNIIFQIKAFAVNRNADIYSIRDIYAVDDIYGLIYSGWFVKVDIQTRKNGVWAENWTEVLAGEYFGDGFRFRLRVKGSSDTVVFVKEFKVSVDVPDRREHYKNVLVPQNGLNFVFDRAFNAPPTVVATILQATGNEDVIIEDDLVSKQGFFVRVANKQGEPVEKYINFLCEGY